MTELKERLARRGRAPCSMQFVRRTASPRDKLVPLAHLASTCWTTGAGFAGPSIWGTGPLRTGP